VCDYIANGGTIAGLRDQDGLPDYMTVYRWEEAFPDFRASLACARRGLADRYARTGLDRLEAVDPDSPFGSARVSKARDTAGHMRWLAGCLDRDTYGERPPQVNVQVNSQFVQPFGGMAGRVAGE